MPKRKFEIGNRVEIISPKTFKGMTGTIIEYDNRIPCPWVIQLDKPLNGGETLLSMMTREIRNIGE